jgi:(p)ppGpp synthase/HD superfamily hydrolase
MAWTEPQYSRRDVNAAGRLLVQGLYGAPNWEFNDWQSFDDAIDVIDNWRASHTFPLNTLQMNLRRCARRLDAAALIAQRVKRLISIGHKLHRFPDMKLTQIQDIGGCRAVLSSVDDVEELFDYYMRKTNMKHQRATVDDYIANPKPSGYRGIHTSNMQREIRSTIC